MRSDARKCALAEFATLTLRRHATCKWLKTKDTGKEKDYCRTRNGTVDIASGGKTGCGIRGGQEISAWRML
ncbi:hypothetical protein [Terriglobus sp. RCC_193]|uniref:hypothetical protein n=1 Tax=Terriglobus sp. RCC_193 TaxID=3239218 RepID=UPI0035245A8D